MKISSTLKERLVKKAEQSIAKFRIVAIGFTKKGNIIGINTSKPSHNRYSLDRHAESGLILKYGGNKIYHIVVMRIGLGGDILPIEPCDGCKSIMARFGIGWSTIDK